MNPRTSGILFALAVALGAFVYFYEIRGGEERKQAEEVAKRIFPGIDADDITALVVTTKDDRKARIERRDGRWQVAEPVDSAGDASTLDRMASTLAQLTSEAEISSPRARSVYGLSDESLAIRFEVGETGYGLRVGRKTPVGANSYVSPLPAGEPERIFTVPTFRVNSLSHSLDELRDRRVLNFDRAAVDRVDVSWPGGGATLERAEGGWQIVEPIVGPADDSTLESLLSDLSFLKAEGFVDEPMSDAEAGLEEPEFAVELRTAAPEEGGEPQVFRLALGVARDGTERLARGSGKALFRVPQERLSDFPRTLTDYRFRQLSSFVVSDVSSLELDFQSDGELAEIRAERTEGEWTSTPHSFAPDVARDLVAELADLKAVEIVADAMGPDELGSLGLSPPRVVLRVRGGSEDGAPKLLAEVHLGHVQADRGILARDAAQSAIYRIDYALAEQIPISYEAFLNRFVSKEEEEEAAGAEDPQPSDLSIDPSLATDSEP